MKKYLILNYSLTLLNLNSAIISLVCYTLSSDDEEPSVAMHPSSIHASQVYNPMESEGSKSDHSSASDMLHHELNDVR